MSEEKVSAQLSYFICERFELNILINLLDSNSDSKLAESHFRAKFIF
jgi:hypothetical protein